MKKTLKTLSVLAFGSMIALSGASYAKAYTNVETQNNVSTYVACDTEITTMCGDITTSEGMTVINEEVYLVFGQEEYLANYKVNISRYETASKEMSNGYDVDVIIDMPDAGEAAVTSGKTQVYTYTAGDENKLGFTISADIDYGWYYLGFAQSDTVGDNDFVLSTDTALKADGITPNPDVMDIYASNSSVYFTLYNDPSSNLAFNAALASNSNNSWSTENTRLVSNEKFYLADLDPTNEYVNNQTMYYDNMVLTPVLDANEKVTGYEVEFDLHTNGHEADEFANDSVTNSEIDVFGHLIIPFTVTYQGVPRTYYYDVVVNTNTGSRTFDYHNFSYDDGTNGDEVADDGVYHIVMTQGNGNGTTNNKQEVSLTEASYRIIDTQGTTVDGDRTDTLNWKAATDGAGYYYTVGNISQATLETSNPEQTVLWDEAFFMPTVQLYPLDETGAVDTSFTPSWITIGNAYDAQYLAKPAEPWTMGAGLISLIVIGSVAAAVGIGFGGYWYSHKHHLKGKYDHHHLERLKHHVAKLEKTVAMDDKKAAEWDAKHHINHKDTKKKK